MEHMDVTPQPQGKTRGRAAHDPARTGTPAQTLTPNNDGDERRDLRRQSAAKVLRKSLGNAGVAAQRAHNTKGMADSELQAMYERVIKLTAENKITKNNAWDLNIIYHMPSIVKDYCIVGQQFNFQRASCGLDAGVSIYAKRVDSVYDSVHQTLGMAVQVNEEDATEPRDQDGADGTQGSPSAEGEAAGKAKAGRRRGKGGDIDPSATLADPASLKAKEMDVTLDSDPLFGRTSRLFDESSTAGLLMLHLGVYGNCQILFESAEVPSAHFLPTELSQPHSADLQFDLPGLHQYLATAAQPQYNITPCMEQLYHELDAAAGGSSSRAWLHELLDDTSDIICKALEEERKAYVAAQAAMPRRTMAPAAAAGAAVTQPQSCPGANPRAEAADNADTGQQLGQPDSMDIGDAWGMDGAAGGCDDDEAAVGGMGSWGSPTAGSPDRGEPDLEPADGRGGGAAAGEVDSSADGTADSAAYQGSSQLAGAGQEAMADNAQGFLGSEQQQQQQDVDHFQVDEDGFVAAPEDPDEGNWQDDGGLPNGDSDAEAGMEEGEQGVGDLSQWLGGHARSLLSAQQAAPAKAARNSAWAGAGFWRYSAAAGTKVQGVAAAAAAAGHKAATRKGKSKQAGSVPQLDTDDEDQELAQRMAQKGRPGDTQLCKRTRAKTLLPEDLHLDSQRLFTLVKAPGGSHDVLSLWKCHATAAAMLRQGPATAPAPAGPRGQATEGWKAGFDEAGDDGMDDGFGVGGFADDEEYGEEGGAAGQQEQGAGDRQAAAEAAGQAMLQAVAEAAAAAGMLGLGGLDLAAGAGQDGTSWLLPAPRQVAKVEVAYDKVAKAVDVKRLKQVIHSSIATKLQQRQEADATELYGQDGRSGEDVQQSVVEVPFQDVIASLNPTVAGTGRGKPSSGDKVTQDGRTTAGDGPSVHLCFICLLHLANEHGLQLNNPYGQLDKLSVRHPVPAG